MGSADLKSVHCIALYRISWFLSEAFLIGWNCSPVPREQFQPIKSFQSKQCILLQPIEIETCLHDFVHFGQRICILSRKSKTKQRLYEATTWFKSSKYISLLAFQHVVSKMNFSIFFKHVYRHYCEFESKIFLVCRISMGGPTQLSASVVFDVLRLAYR